MNKWYIVFDGSSFYSVMENDLNEFLSEDPEVNEVIEGPITDDWYLDKKVEHYNDKFVG